MEADRNMFMSYTFKRFAGGHMERGRWVDGTESSVSAIASVQPFTSRQLLLLPEGKRQKGWVKIFTSTELTCLEGEGENQQADQVLYNGSYYEVQSRDKWDNCLKHYEYDAARVND